MIPLLAALLQAQTSPIFGILNSGTTIFPTTDPFPPPSTKHWGSRPMPICYAESPRPIRSAIRPVAVVLHAQTSSIFIIGNTATQAFSTSDPFIPQSTGHWRSRPRPIQCAESPRAICLAIRRVVLVLQAQTFPIFGI